MKYKVGNIVQVKLWCELEKKFELDEDGDLVLNKIAFSNSMRKYCGKEFIILRSFLYYDDDRYKLEYLSDGSVESNENIFNYLFSNDMIASPDEINSRLDIFPKREFDEELL